MPELKDIIRAAFNDIEVAAWAIDTEGTVLMSEGAHVSRLGFQPGQIVGFNLFQMYAGKEDAIALFRRALAGESCEFEADQDGRYTRTRIRPLRDGDGAIVGAVAITEDLTEERQTQAQIAEQTASLREQAELLDLTHDAIIVRDLDGVITSWNRGAERLYGHSADQARGKVAVDLLASALPVAPAAIERELRTKEFWEGEIRQASADGREVIAASRWILRRGDDGRPAAVLQIDTDITARRRAQEAEARRKEELIRAQAAAIEELSTPLIPITDQILVMPLIGAMDSMRAKHVIDNLLAGISEVQGEFVIIDITGLPVVDTAVASVLLKAAKAVRLLGAEVVLTGMNSSVAQTLVNIDVDLTDIVTRGTLQSGIQYALGRRKLST
ncbi:MAG: PAS domain S-box protein [Myxococcales bacterium]|nr:PAS domain S-box protein [Myxococcales bacterium]